MASTDVRTDWVGHPDHWKELERRVPLRSKKRVHPTHLHFESPNSNRKIHWNSRDHRKGRGPIIEETEEEIEQVGHWIFSHKWWSWEPRNISWQVAQWFTWGSIAWVINGFLVLLPRVTTSVNNDTWAQGLSALVGGTLFEVGAILAYLEALNRDEHVMHQIPRDDDDRSASDRDKTRTPQPKKRDADPKPSDRPKTGTQAASKRTLRDADRRMEMAMPRSQTSKVPEKRKFRFFGLRLSELGFQAALIQVFAATVFWMSTFTGVPGVIDQSNVGQVQGLYWTPQVVGGMGFIIASLILMYEVQPHWWRIRPKDIGWEVGFWNLIGALGFTLCGIFGYYGFADKYQTWGMALSTFWGGWAFLIGSYIQLWEAMNPN